jgi:SAM-dependent methyltransferase
MRFACRQCARELEPANGRAHCEHCGLLLVLEDDIWRAMGDGEPAGFSPARREHLAALLPSHFWFPPRHRLLCRRIDLVGQGFRSALELGCGTGTFLPELARRAAAVAGVDGYSASLREARRRCPQAELLAADLDLGLPLAPGQFDLVVSFDVLEHVEPGPLLDEIHRLCADRALLVLAVPAGRALWSRLDEDAGHRRRYDRRALEIELTQSGFRLLSTTHYQMLLLPLAFVARRFAGRRAHRIERHPPPLLGRILGAVNAFEVSRFGSRRLPWGMSLIATAQRTG